MSNFESFFKQYEELASEYSHPKELFESLGVVKTKSFFGRMNKHKKEGTMPPPSMLKHFKSVMDPNFLLDCMDEYMDHYKSNDAERFDKIKMDFINAYRKEESEELKQKRRTRKKAVARHYLEKAWNVEE